MGAAYFYHLTQRPLEATLPALLTKSLAVGWRVYVRGNNANHLQELNDTLWLGAKDSFLPHGLAGGAHDADQPVLLGSASDSPNAATCLICIDRADVTTEEVRSLERVCMVFDGNDQTALDHARTQWKTLVDAGCSAQYWSEESGNWQKKAER